MFTGTNSLGLHMAAIVTSTGIETNDSPIYWNPTTSYLTIQLGEATSIDSGLLFNVTILKSIIWSTGATTSIDIKTPSTWTSMVFDSSYVAPTISIQAAAASTTTATSFLNIYRNHIKMDVPYTLYQQQSKTNTETDGKATEKKDIVSSFSQFVATTSKAYIETETFNSTNYFSALPPSTGFMDIVKPPPRVGHTTNALSSSFMERSIKRDLLVFGGNYNGIRSHLWIYRPGVFNETEIIEEGRSSIPDSSGNFNIDLGYLNLRDASGNDLTDDSKRCGQSKQSRAFPHLCNTWQPANATIKRKKCSASSSSLRTQTLLVVEGIYCGGLGTSKEKGLLLQTCSSNLTQRIYFKVDDHTMRIGALLDKYGERSHGYCLTADMQTNEIHVEACTALQHVNQIIHVESTSSSSSNNGDMYQIRFNSTNKCIAISTSIGTIGTIGTTTKPGPAASHTSSSKKSNTFLPSIHILNNDMLGTRFVQLPCSIPTIHIRNSPTFSSFQLINATNECQDISYTYDVQSISASGVSYQKNQGRHLGRYEHSASILYPSDSSNTYESDTYGKLFVYGGQDFQNGILSDVWSYDVRLKEWSQLHDGDGWRTASDAHLHGQPTINAADYESSYRSATAPEPRHLHTSIPVYSSISSEISKQINIRETQYVSSIALYRNIKYLCGLQMTRIFPDNDESGTPTARTRDYRMWVVASQLPENIRWDGATYPFTFVFTEVNSIVTGYTVTLLNATSVQIFRPSEYDTGYTTQRSKDKFVTNSISSSSTYNVNYIYTCSSQDDALVTFRLQPLDPECTDLTCPPSSCNRNSVWATGYEYYKILETKLNLVKSTSTTNGRSQTFIYGEYLSETERASRIWKHCS